MTKEQQVGERLNTFRIELGLTQTAFAQTVGIKQGYLNQVIKGHRGISATIIQNIATAYKTLNLRWLLTGEGEMYELATLPPEPPPYELSQGEPPTEQVQEGITIQYLKKEGQLESIERRIREHERRLRDLEGKSP